MDGYRAHSYAFVLLHLQMFVVGPNKHYGFAHVLGC